MPHEPAPRRRTGAYVAIAAIVASVGGAFAWTAGWLSPDRLTPARMTDAIEATSTTPYPGFRRAHAKGLCVSGHFEGHPDGAALSRARVFAYAYMPGLLGLAEGLEDIPFLPDADVAGDGDADLH